MYPQPSPLESSQESADEPDPLAPPHAGSDADSTDDPTGDDIPFDRDIPCIRCGYNLRGLKPDGNCPECGARIRKSLNFAMERILCLACMRPAHPSATKCPHCGAPMNSAASTANYWQIAPRGVARRDSASPPKPLKPFPWHIVAWFFCGPLAAYFFLMTLAVAAHSLLVMLCFALSAALALLPPIVLTRLYRRRHATYLHDAEEARAASLDASNEETPAEPRRRLLPRPSPPMFPRFVFPPLALVFLALAVKTLPDIAIAGPFLGAAGLLILLLLKANAKYHRQRVAYQRQTAALRKELEEPQTAKTGI